MSIVTYGRHTSRIVVGMIAFSILLLAGGAGATQTANPYPGGNFWANPSTTGFKKTDADRNGICDSPYPLESNNIDYLPLASAPLPPAPGSGGRGRGEKLTITMEYPVNNPTYFQSGKIVLSGSASGGLAPYKYAGHQKSMN